MRICRGLLSAVLVLSPLAARAQDGGDNDWSGELAFKMAPSLGASTAGSNSQSAPIVDDSAYELGVSATYSGLEGVPIQVAFKGIYNPDQYEQEPTSTLRADLVVGVTKPSSSIFSAWGEVNFMRVWDRCLIHYDDPAEAEEAGACEETGSGFFKGDPRWDTNLRVGVAFVPGPALSATFTLDQTFSTDPDEERIVPRAEVTLNSPWDIWGIKPSLVASLDVRAYEKRRVGNGEKRTDTNLTIGPSFSFDEFFHIGSADHVAIAIPYQKRWSNLEGEPYSRFYLVPQVSLLHTF